jgi:YCII-related domain
MKEFVMIIRLEEVPEVKFSSGEMHTQMAVWEKWIDGIISKNILTSRGNRLGKDGRTIRNGKVVTNGPFAEIKEIIGGYIIIRANSINEAAEIASEAPLVGSGSIEVRDIYSEGE